MRTSAFRGPPEDRHLGTPALPDPSRTFLPGKSVQYLEQSVANWVMSGDVLAFMIPEMSLATPHYPKALKAKHYVDALDGLVLQGGADMAPESYREAPINPLWAGDRVRDQYEIELFNEFVTQGKPVLGICRGHQVIKRRARRHALPGHPDAGAGYAPAPPRGALRQPFPRRAHPPRHVALAALPGRRREALQLDPPPGDQDARRRPRRRGESEPDGIVEAVRWEGHSFVVGVQWHPEFMAPNDPRLVESEPLLRAFLGACDRRKKTGRATPVMSKAA
jgi:putative glutamine amidotransferase